LLKKISMTQLNEVIGFICKFIVIYGQCISFDKIINAPNKNGMVIAIKRI